MTPRRRILLHMHFDHSQEWLRLAGEYRAKGDEELYELYRDLNDLTEVAQQALRAELQSRGLDKKIADAQQAAASKNGQMERLGLAPVIDRTDEGIEGDVFGSTLGSNVRELVRDDEADDADANEPVEYSWKTVLCECEEKEQAYQIWEVLKRAGIESWIQPRASGLIYTRVLVAADELDRAQAIVARPIPQDIIDESREIVPEFEPPRCPSCGAEDPTLESVEPVNTWKCESCGREWADEGSAPPPSSPFT